MARVVFTAALFAALAVSAAALSHDHAFIRDPEAALKLDADTVTAELESAVREHYLLKHDYLQCFQNQGFTDMRGAVRIFAENHYTYSKNFIKYLRMVADKVRPELQHLLLENIAEEEGNYEDEDLDTLEAAGVKREWVNKKPHRDLIRRFLNAAEVDQSMFNRTDHPGGRFTSWIIKKYEDANACEALSMIGFAIEETVSILYSYLWNGLKTTDMDPEDFVFFPLHILVDDGHADLLKNGFKAYWRENPEQCKAAPRLVLEVLDRRSVMMDELRDLVDTEFGATCDVPVNPNRPASIAVPTSGFNSEHVFIRDPEAAVALSSKEVVSELERAVREHYLLKHDYLQCFQNQGFTDMRGAVRIFAENHYTYSKNFIKYLRMVADKVRPELQHLLLENIAEEEGNYEDEDLDTLEAAGVKREWVNKKPHRDLIRRFLNAAEVDQSMFNRTDHPGGRFTSWIIKKYEDANACEALSMIGFAIEETVSILYSYLWNGLKTTDMDPEDYVFFPLHILVDDGHADLLKAGFAAYWDENPEQCKAAPRLVLEVLDRRSVMMDELRGLVDAEFGATCEIPYSPVAVASRSSDEL